MFALRDLMRMEMPERWADVTTAPVTLPIVNIGLANNPALWQHYHMRLANPPANGYGARPCRTISRPSAFTCGS